MSHSRAGSRCASRCSGEPPDDLIQVASLALLKVVDRWHPEMGYAFSSYAVPTILGELRRYFRDTTWIVRPPRGLIELSLLVESERQKFGAVLGREPTVAELAERLDRPHAAVSAAVEAHASRVPRSLHSTADDAEPDPATIGDVIGFDDAEYERAEARTTIERLTSILDPRARDVLRMRFQHDVRHWRSQRRSAARRCRSPGSSGRRSSGCPSTPPWPAADGR